MGGPIKCEMGYCEISGGTFTMGSVDRDGDLDERPVNEVTLDSFKLRKTEVTVSEFEKFVKQTRGAQLKAVVFGCRSLDHSQVIVRSLAEETEINLINRSKAIAIKGDCNTENIVIESQAIKGFPEDDDCKKMNGMGDDHPVVCLTNEDADAFCGWEGGLVPTAAQLEYASKGVSGTDEYGTPISKAVIWDNGYHSTAPVCGLNFYRENSYGVCDLAGNVLERARDQYDSDYYSRMPEHDPHNRLTDPDNQPQEFRGGSWNHERRNARASFRDDGHPNDSLTDLGFRCVRPMPQKTKK